MDLDDFRSILREYGVDVWAVIEAAISVAATDCAGELKERRDGIVERLYSMLVRRCPNCDGDQSGAGAVEVERRRRASVEKERSDDARAASPSRMTRSTDGEDDQEPIQDGRDSIDREKNKILAIKEHLEDPSQVWR